MKGNNAIIFNEATMIEAVQEYLDERAYSKSALFEVVSVKTHQDGFRIAVKERPEPERT